MEITPIEISIRGKAVRVPSIPIHGRTVVASGKWLKIAYVHDEMLMEGEVVDDPKHFIETAKKAKLGADIFTFAQKQTEDTPKHRYYFEWDNAAIIRITSFANWEKRVAPDVRKAVRKAERLGVVVQPSRFDDAFVQGIIGIYNESPTRQGRAFWHYGKDFETVKRENSTLLERSEFVGAYYEGELIGFIKMVYVGQIASTLQVISKAEHSDKKPTNALIRKAVEICERKGITHLQYGRYSDTTAHNSLTEFKRRNGFEEFRYPRYYAPLTFKGSLSLKLGLHRGFKRLLPEKSVNYLRRLRSRYSEAKVVKRPRQPQKAHSF